MSFNKQVPDGKDPLLWQLAQKRACFKNHLISYVIINAFLWALWYVTGNRFDTGETYLIPWPAWTTIGWGCGLAYQFAAAYILPKENSTEREYEKLNNKSNH